MCKIYLLKILEKDLKKVREPSTDNYHYKIKLHSLKERDLLRKAFLVLFEND